MDPDQVTFNESYRQLWQPLPASQRREAIKRLTTRRKDPLPIESLGDEHPDIEACLTRLSEAYDRKKVRCAKTSAQRRFLKKTADAVAAETVAEPVAETVAAPAAEPVAEPVAAPAEPAEIVAVSEAEPTQTSADEEPAPAPAPAPVKKKAARARAKPAPAPPAPAAPVDTPPAPVDKTAPEPAQAPQKADARTLLGKRAPRQGGVPPASSVGRPLIDRRGGTPTPGS